MLMRVQVRAAHQPGMIFGTVIFGAFSGPKQPPNPEQKSHPIRRNPASVPEQNSHRPFVGLG